MPLKNRFVLISLFLLLAALLAVWFTPFAVSHGVRWWIWWRARQEGFTVNVDKIDAPFLRSVVIRQLRPDNVHDDTLRVDLTITDALFDLNFKHILLHRGGRAIRNLSIRELHGELRRTNPTVRAIITAAAGRHCTECFQRISVSPPRRCGLKTARRLFCCETDFYPRIRPKRAVLLLPR